MEGWIDGAMELWSDGVGELVSTVAAAKRRFGMREISAKQRKLLMHIGRVFGLDGILAPRVLGFDGHVLTSGFG